MRFSIIRRATVSRASFPKLFNAQHSTHKKQDRIARFGFSDPGFLCLLRAIVRLLRVACFACCPLAARHPSAIHLFLQRKCALLTPQEPQKIVRKTRRPFWADFGTEEHRVSFFQDFCADSNFRFILRLIRSFPSPWAFSRKKAIFSMYEKTGPETGLVLRPANRLRQNGTPGRTLISECRSSRT